MPLVLIVDDEPAITDALSYALAQEHFEVARAGLGREALAFVRERGADLVVLDIGLPDMSGLEFTRQLKRDANLRDLPVIMLTARAEEADKVAGLEGGADDYITKPFSPRELIARINAVLRRSDPQVEGEVLNFDGLQLDPVAHRVLAHDKPVTLGPTEYRMLEFFMTHPDRVYSREQLLDRIWGGNVYVEERTIDVHIRRLRKALEEFGYDRMVQTVRGAGYRFSTRVE